jgi:voltage-gated potassium channel
VEGTSSSGTASLNGIREQSRKERVHHVLAITYPNDAVTRAVGLFITALIILNVLVVILETVQSLNARFGSVFYYLEMFSVAVFTVEYVLRVWSCTVDERYASPIRGRLRYAVTPLALIDLLAIAPFYPEAFLGVRNVGTTFIRALRLFRLMRLFKTTRYSRSLQVMGRVLRAKKEQVIVTLIIVGILLVLLSSAMYFVEKSVQPEDFSSIPQAMWWGVSALTTVGYGDVVPQTGAGKVIAAIVSLLGIGLFAMPAGILASGFTEEYRTRHGQGKTCPHCGREIE